MTCVTLCLICDLIGLLSQTCSMRYSIGTIFSQLLKSEYSIMFLHKFQFKIESIHIEHRPFLLYSSPKKGWHTPPIFSPCLMSPNGWMDQDPTRYGGRPWLRRHCVRWGPSSPPKGAQPPNFRPMSIVAKQLYASGYHFVWR